MAKIITLLIDMPMSSWFYCMPESSEYAYGNDDQKAKSISCDETNEEYAITLENGERRYWNYKNVAGHKVSFEVDATN